MTKDELIVSVLSLLFASILIGLRRLFIHVNKAPGIFIVRLDPGDDDPGALDTSDVWPSLIDDVKEPELCGKIESGAFKEAPGL